MFELQKLYSVKDMLLTCVICNIFVAVILKDVIS